MVFLKNLRYGSMMSSFFLAHTDNVKFKCLDTENWVLHSDLWNNFINMSTASPVRTCFL